MNLLHKLTVATGTALLTYIAVDTYPAQAATFNFSGVIDTGKTCDAMNVCTSLVGKSLTGSYTFKVVPISLNEGLSGYFSQDPPIYFIFNIDDRTYETPLALNGGFSYLYQRHGFFGLGFADQYTAETYVYSPDGRKKVDVLANFGDYNYDAVANHYYLTEKPPDLSKFESARFYFNSVLRDGTPGDSVSFQGYFASISNAATVPEPTTMLGLLLAGVTGVVWKKKYG
jgi:hypothetical protein